MAAEADAIADLRRLIEILRGDGGCPWDRKQTPRSMMRYLVEEVFELLDAVESNDADAVCEELGDVLFQLLFLVHLYREQGHFTLSQVAGGVQTKMVRRHPHVFGTAQVETSAQVRDQWLEIKRREKKPRAAASILDAVPAGMPALMRAYRISARAAGEGFDWPDLADLLDKAEEEWGEFKAELSRGDSQALSLEFGDVLFTLVNVARFAGLHPETSLVRAIRKFERRFRDLERRVAADGRPMREISAARLDAFWNQAKEQDD